MKKIIFRKLLFDCLIFFLITLLSLSLIIWVFQAVNFLDIIIEDGRDHLVYLKYSLLNLPKIVSKLIPFSIFIAFFYTLNKYETNNQLIIFWNFGVNKLELIYFIFKFSLFFLLVQLILSTFIVPKSQDYARTLIRDSSTIKFESFVKPKKFNDNIKGLTIFAEKKDRDGYLINVYLKKENKINDFQITYAKKGIIQNINNYQTLILFNGQTLNFINNQVNSFTFSRSDFNVSNLETNITTYIKTQENSTKHLYSCVLEIQKDLKITQPENCSISNYSNVIKELYKRIYIPIYIPLLVLTTLLLIIYSKEEVNHFKMKLFILFFGFVIIILSEMSIRFVEITFLQNFKILIIPFIILISFLIFINFKLKFKNKNENLY